MSNLNRITRDNDLGFTSITNNVLRAPDWELSVAGLMKVLPEGEAAIRGAIGELEKAGYCTRERLRDPETKAFSGTSYHFRQVPVKPAPEPHVENPHVENPHVGSPVVGNQGQYKKEGIKTEGSKKDSVPNGTGGEAAAAPAAESDHAKAMRLLRERIGPYPDGGAQAKALKWMVDNGATYPAIIQELDRQIEAAAEKGFRPSFLTVQKTIFTGEAVAQHQPAITLPAGYVPPPAFEMPTLSFGGYIHEGGARHDQ
jgi:hypothetical protein